MSANNNIRIIWALFLEFWTGSPSNVLVAVKFGACVGLIRYELGFDKNIEKRVSL